MKDIKYICKFIKSILIILYIKIKIINLKLHVIYRKLYYIFYDIWNWDFNLSRYKLFKSYYDKVKKEVKLEMQNYENNRKDL